MTSELLVAGGGIGGLAAAVAAARAGWSARVFERADAFEDVGAGIQLAPNATRILREWGVLDGPLAERAARPRRIVACDALDGGELAALPLEDFESRYGGPYLTVHRADLHAALLGTAIASGAHLHAGRGVEEVHEREDAIQLRCSKGMLSEGDALVAADGLWSALRAPVMGDAAQPRFTGHLAYRALVPLSPAAGLNADVVAWLGPHMHVVSYPVRAGEFLNLVCIVEGPLPAGALHSWNHDGVREHLLASIGRVCPELRLQLESVPAWRLWPLHLRPALAGAHGMAKGRTALLGDAAHPMLPYLAQGAGMAIEDARELQRVLPVADGKVLDVPTALQRYALSRWQRCAKVQARSQRNGAVFHARGPLRIARNVGLRALGARLMDLPWLYGG